MFVSLGMAMTIAGANGEAEKCIASYKLNNMVDNGTFILPICAVHVDDQKLYMIAITPRRQHGVLEMHFRILEKQHHPDSAEGLRHGGCVLCKVDEAAVQSLTVMVRDITSLQNPSINLRLEDGATGMISIVIESQDSHDAQNGDAAENGDAAHDGNDDDRVLFCVVLH